MSRDIDFGSDEENIRMGSRLDYLIGQSYGTVLSFCTRCKKRTKHKILEINLSSKQVECDRCGKVSLIPVNRFL